MERVFRNLQDRGINVFEILHRGGIYDRKRSSTFHLIKTCIF